MQWGYSSLERNIAIDFKVDATVDDEKTSDLAGLKTSVESCWRFSRAAASAHLDMGFRDVMLERSADGGNERAAKLMGLHKKLWREAKIPIQQL